MALPKKDEQPVVETAEQAIVEEVIVEPQAPVVELEKPVETVSQEKILGTGPEVHAQLHLLKTVKLVTVNSYPLRNQYNNLLYTSDTALTVGDINADEASFERTQIFHGLLSIQDHD